jgi:hypothetical protein
MFSRIIVNGRYADIFRQMNAALKKGLVCDIFKEEKIVMKILKKKKNMLVKKLLFCRDYETPDDCPRVNLLLHKQP